MTPRTPHGSPNSFSIRPEEVVNLAESNSANTRNGIKMNSLQATLKASKCLSTRKRFRFDNAEDQGNRDTAKGARRRMSEQPGDSESSCHATLDLRKTAASVCSHLFDTVTHQPANGKESCLGFLTTPDSHELFFYGANSKRYSAEFSRPIEVMPLKGILASIERIQRLRLALTISRAVLSFSATPWLPANWRLQDLMYFGRPQRLLDLETKEELKTLHLTTELSDPSVHDAAAMEITHDDAESSHTVDDAHLYNVRNLTLANLGIALLEIALGKDIGRFRKSHEPQDVITARKVADGYPTPLGPRYQTLVRKCLHCDFACDADLATGNLQDAVYTDMVCSLENLIESCEKLGLE